MAKRKMVEGRAKVFCGECKYSAEWDGSAMGDHWCTHPSCYVDTYWQRGGKRVIDLEEKNKDNDCPDYEALPEEPKAEPKGRLQLVREWLMG